MAYVIGLDIGTTSAKAVMFEQSGRFIYAVEKEIETLYKKKDWAEQNVNQIDLCCKAALKQLIKESGVAIDDIIAVSFCSAMHSLVAVNKEGDALTDAIIWSDRRAHEVVSKLLETNKQDIYERTGTPIHPMTPFSKLLWMKEKQKELYNEKPFWMSIKEYIVFRWFNVRWIDYSMASATGLLNLQNKVWDKQLLTTLQLEHSQLSTIHSPRTQLPEIIEEVRMELGLSNKTVFVLGAADGQLASLGIGAIGEGELAVSVGTSGALREYTSNIQLSQNRATFCYSFDDHYYIVGGPTNNGGVILQWLKNIVANDMDYVEFLKLAENVSIGADGLLFLPYLNGERAPLWDAAARGNFFGLSIDHDRAHMVRATIEGITYNLYHILKSKQENEVLDCIYVNGGLSQSKLWLQMLADLFNCKVYISDTHHGAAWGACWIALISLGKQSKYEDIKYTVKYEHPIQPNERRHKLYVEQYEKFKQLLHAVHPLFN